MRRLADGDAAAHLLLLEAKARLEAARAGATDHAGDRLARTPRPSAESGRVGGLGTLARRLLEALSKCDRDLRRIAPTHDAAG
jgi:hypothetical protein